MAILSRRRFLQIGAGAAGAGAAAAVLPGTPAWAELLRSGAPRRPHRARAHLLRPLLLEVRRDRHHQERQALEDRGQPRRPALPRPPLPARHRRRRRPLRHRPPPCAARPAQEPGRRRMGRGDLGRGALAHRREAPEDQGRARPRGARLLQPRHRRQLPQAHLQGLRHAEPGGALLRAVPRAARRRLPAHLRRGDLDAGADRHPERPLPGAARLAPRREHAQQPGPGVRRGGRLGRHGDRRRPALLGRGEQGEALPADQARAPTSRCCSPG